MKHKIKERLFILMALAVLTVVSSVSSIKGQSPAPTATPVDETPRQQGYSEEEAAILPYYNNYLREYHLGPEDVISVSVFDQPKYSKQDIIVPPTARISYPLIPAGIFVGGKTTDDVAKEIAKALDEYIIEPKVTVTLEKVGSARFSILGKVQTPGVKMMNRRYNIYEAIAEAGGIIKEGDPKRVLLIRMEPGGGYTQKVINFEEIVKGSEPVTYLAPGDQIVVPEKRWSLTKIFEVVGRVGALRLLLGSPGI